MNINCLFRYLIAALLFAGLPFGSFAAEANCTSVNSAVHSYQDRRGSKQDRGKGGKEQKKPQVKEVPQSRKQQKPSEVKQDKKEKNSKDNKRRN